MVMLWEPVRRGQAESRARLPTPTCSSTPRAGAVPAPLLTAKDNVTDGKIPFSQGIWPFTGLLHEGLGTRE